MNILKKYRVSEVLLMPISDSQKVLYLKILELCKKIPGRYVVISNNKLCLSLEWKLTKLKRNLLELEQRNSLIYRDTISKYYDEKDRKIYLR